MKQIEPLDHIVSMMREVIEALMPKEDLSMERPIEWAKIREELKQNAQKCAESTKCGQTCPNKEGKPIVQPGAIKPRRFVFHVTSCDEDYECEGDSAIMKDDGSLLIHDGRDLVACFRRWDAFFPEKLEE